MATGLYKTIKGTKTQLTSRQVKAEIMKIRGWDETTYNRERKQLTKRINTYNILMDTGGGAKIDRTAVQILYTQSKAMKRYGADYEASPQTQALFKMSATSGNARSTKSLDKARENFNTYVNERFAGLIQHNAKAREIAEKIKDPVKRENALSRFANDMHEAIGESKKKTSQQAIPFSSQSYGSDSYDVDISSYLDEDVNEDVDEDMTEVNPDDIFA